MNYQEALAYLNDLEVHGIILGLDRMRRLLSDLGDPHHRFRSIHIAGTNGKGSTAAYIVSILEASGGRVGLYTSPHLERFTERILISGEEIPTEQVARYMEKILSIIQAAGADFKPTYFEVTTALAFAYFAEMGVELAVVETGLGGRLDATNVVVPEICVITNVALEHTEYLGNTVEEIAREKAGIIKKGVEVLTAESNPRALAVIEEICRRQSSRLSRLGPDFQVEVVAPRRSQDLQTFNYLGVDHRWEGLTISLLGAYQLKNAGLALAVIESLLRKGWNVSQAALRNGLSAARWPGRMEIVSSDPFVIIDGAHNPHAVQALVSTLEKEIVYRRLILVIGILQDKDILTVVTPLLAHTDALILTKPQYFRGADPQTVLKMVEREGLQVCVREEIPDAINHALSLYEPGDLILITGSLYTVGEARTCLLQD